MVPVRDLANQRRLLGYLTERPALRRGHTVFKQAVLHPAPVVPPQDPSAAVIPFRTVTFHTDWREDDDGWTARREFITDAPLSDLLALPNFRLPNESEGEAAFRRRYMTRGNYKF